MNKRLYGVMSIGLSFVLLTGCYSSPSAKQADEPSPAQTTVSPQKQSERGKITDTLTAGVTAPSQDEAKPSGNARSVDAPVAPQKPSEAAPSEPQHQAETTSSEPQPQAETTSPSAVQKPEESASDAGVKAAGETVEQVKQRYEAQLAQLKGSYLGQIQQFYNEAIAAKRGGQSKRDIYNTYSTQAVAQEEKSQEQVNGLLFQMKDELTTHSLPTESVNELRAAYYAELANAQQSFEQKAKTDIGM